jgi:hypothetical protein
MSMQPTILAIDNGTQSVRALLFDLQREYRRQIPGHAGGLFFRAARLGRARPEDYWQALCRPARACGASPAWTRRAVQGVAVTTQRGTVVSLDKRRQAAAPGHHLARPAPHRYVYPAARLVVARGLQAGARRRHHRLLPRRGRDQLDPRPPARHLGGDRQVPAAVRLPELAPVRALRRFQRLAGRPICPSTTSAAAGPRAATGSGRRWRSSRTCCPSWWNRASNWARSKPRPPRIPASRRHAAAGRGRRQGLRSDRRRLPRAARRLPELRHHGHHQHHQHALRRGDALRAALSGGDAGAYSTEVQVFRGYWMVNWFKEQFGHHEQLRALAEDVAPEQLFDRWPHRCRPARWA